MVHNGNVKVLIVDDLKDNLLALDGLLRREGVQIVCAKSGVEALELMLANEFAVALVDVQMPGMSGFELAELMRGAKRTREIPIIFVTATAEHKSFAFKGYECGGVDFLLKPLDTHAVKSKVNIFIELYQQKREIKAQFGRVAELNAALKQSKDEAERSNAAKTEFLANMSHEIRTPLSAIMGFAEQLLDPEISADEHESNVQTIIRNGHVLMRLIDEILDLSKVEAGGLETEILKVSLPLLLGEVVDHLGRRAADKGIALRVTTEAKVPDAVLTDPTRLRQVLNNIISNAIKYTVVGEVVVTVDCRPATATQPAQLIFRVKDTGIGIDTESVDRLFKPFSQADSSTTRIFGGTGLGLVLSKKLARALGGDVVLEKSTRGAGSVFVVTIAMIPCLSLSDAPTPSATTMTQVALQLVGLKVLLAEDAPDNRALLTKILIKQGCIVVVASNGIEAVERASEEQFDVILMDIQMPELDGFGALSRLRKAGYDRPIIALTAHAMKESVDRCVAAGFDAHLSKPLDSRMLIETIGKLGREGRLKLGQADSLKVQPSTTDGLSL